MKMRINIPSTTNDLIQNFSNLSDKWENNDDVEILWPKDYKIETDGFISQLLQKEKDELALVLLADIVDFSEVDAKWYEQLKKLNDTAILVSIALKSNLSPEHRGLIIASKNQDAIEHLKK